MAFFSWLCLIAGLSPLGVAGRAVNISSAWFLPQEGFPVFYRYFNEKVTWNEAEAACKSNHADLLSVETSSQLDAARAYLKEIDVTDNIWIGLRRESPEKPFSWTSGDKLLGDGYWTEPVPKTNEKLCAAIDPVADFRWNSFYCRGPQLASFVCELPVPEWANEENGCLISSLPSLTITLIPEVGVIQLLSDCGLDGTRRIACSAGLNHDEIIKRLSCDVDAFASTMFNSRSTTAEALREVNTRQSLRSDRNDLVSHYETTKTWVHTRHRRSEDSIPGNTVNTLSEGQTTSSPPLSRSPSLRSGGGGGATQRAWVTAPEGTGKSLGAPPTTAGPLGGSAPAFNDLPVVVITEKKSNESASSATSENPPIILMIENKDPEEPFLLPLSDDMFINQSLTPVEVVNVDVVEVDNVTGNGTRDAARNPVAPPEAPAAVRPLRFANGVSNGSRFLPTWKHRSQDAKDYSDPLDEDRGLETPPRPNRGGRSWTRSYHPSFYPRFLNRVLG